MADASVQDNEFHDYSMTVIACLCDRRQKSGFLGPQFSSPAISWIQDKFKYLGVFQENQLAKRSFNSTRGPGTIKE